MMTKYWYEYSYQGRVTKSSLFDDWDKCFDQYLLAMGHLHPALTGYDYRAVMDDATYHRGDAGKPSKLKGWNDEQE